MPGIDKQCEGEASTHHHACACRERYFRGLEKELAEALVIIEDLGYPTGSASLTRMARFEKLSDDAKKFLAKYPHP